MVAQMTWQLEDTIGLFNNTTVDNNGEVGDPIWIGDFNFTWNKGNVTLFYGLDVIGGTSDERDILINQGSLCRTSIFRPGAAFCPDTRLSPTFYHAASLTLQVGETFAITAGMANIFNTAPPRASTVFAGIRGLGQAPAFGTQYDLLGRRAFVNVCGSF